MPEKDYVHAIYIIGIILVLAPIVQGVIFYLVQLDKSPTYAGLSAGTFYASALFQTAGIMMILYVAYNRFMEGCRSVKMNNDATE